MGPIIGKVGGSGDDRVQSLYSDKKKNTLFSDSRGLFNTKKRKMFI